MIFQRLVVYRRKLHIFLSEGGRIRGFETSQGEEIREEGRKGRYRKGVRGKERRGGQREEKGVRC